MMSSVNHAVANNMEEKKEQNFKNDKTVEEEEVVVMEEEVMEEGGEEEDEEEEEEKEGKCRNQLVDLSRGFYRYDDSGLDGDGANVNGNFNHNRDQDRSRNCNSDRDSDRNRDRKIRLIVTYASRLAELDRAQILDHAPWTSGPINIQVSTSLSNDTSRIINLTPSIGHGKKNRHRPYDSNSWFLSSTLNENNKEFRSKHIHPILVSACGKVGFKVTCRYIKSIKKIRVECQRGQFHNEEKNQKMHSKKNYIRKTNCKKGKGVGPHNKLTQLPIKQAVNKAKNSDDDSVDQSDQLLVPRSVSERDNSYLCYFKFGVFYSDELHRWYFPH